MGVTAMGLDCFASRSLDDIELTDEDERAFVEADLHLCGGFYSGGGSSFRGKVYSDLIAKLTDVYIWENLTPAQVRELSTRLDTYTPEQMVEASKDTTYPLESTEECRSLQMFFRICAERGLGLLAWG